MGKLSSPLLLCLILLPLAIACQKSEEKNASPDSVDLNVKSETSQVQSSEIPNILITQGIFVPSRRIKIKSEFNGRLEDLSVVKGQTISKGSKLLTIEDEKLPLELDGLRGELQRAEAELEQNKRLATTNESKTAPIKEEEIVQAEQPVYNYTPYREPTFSELASEIRFTSKDAGGIWPGIDPEIIQTSRDPEDAGGIWPAYVAGEKEMVNGEGYYSFNESQSPMASLASSYIPESYVAPATTPIQVASVAQTTPQVRETSAPTRPSEIETRLSLDQARIEVLQAKIALVEQELSSRTLSSPLDGKVLEVGTSDDSQVQPNDFLLEIAQVEPIEFSFQIPKDQVRFLELGMKVKGKLSHSPNLPFEGEISFIAAELSDDKKTVEVRAQVENPNDEFKLSMEGSAEVETGQKGISSKGFVTK